MHLRKNVNNLVIRPQKCTLQNLKQIFPVSFDLESHSQTSVKVVLVTHFHEIQKIVKPLPRKQKAQSLQK